MTRWAKAVGVTRIARLTGLDRIGVEVASAIRPGGHILQVCNGKGGTFEQAALGAVLEAAELYCSEEVTISELVYGTQEELGAWRADEMGSAGSLVEPELEFPNVFRAYRRGRELFTGADVLIPACAVHCPPADGPLLGPATVHWTSNGMGAHPSFESALEHALLEAVERHGLARALPHGWTEEAMQERAVDLHAFPSVAKRVRDMEERGYSVHLMSITTQFLGVPVAGALLVDMENGPIPVTAGYAAAHRWEDALHSALLEAAQSRLTDVHGAREDVTPMPAQDVERLRKAMERAGRGRKRLSLRNMAGRGSASVLKALHKAGYRRVAAVDLAPPGLGLHVVKVIIPGFLVSELL